MTRRRRIFRNPFRGDVGREVDEELSFHLEMKTRHFIEQGMEPDAAERAARQSFGNVAQISAEVGEMEGRAKRIQKRSDRLGQLRQDGAFAARQAFRSPGVSAVVVLTVAFAMAVTTAVFSVLDGVLLRPLPFEDSEELVSVWADYSRLDVELPDLYREWLSWPNFVDFRDEVPAVEAAAVWSGWRPILTGSGEAVQTNGGVVSYGMFSQVLGVEPSVGRGFLPEEDLPGGPLSVLISDGFWRTTFGGDPQLVGREIRLNDRPMTVVGIMPADFTPPDFLGTDLWALFQVDPTRAPRGGANFRAVGRLADGASIELARDQAAALASRLELEYPDVNQDVGYSVFSLQKDLVRHASTAVWILFGAVCCILLMACVNVANLLLARGATREGELAVRVAVGAGRARIVTQLLTESTLLVGLGGLLGIALSFVATDLLVTVAPEGTARLSNVAVDGRILAFGLVVTAVAGLLCGTLPALRGSQAAPGGALRESGRSRVGARSGRLRDGLVVAQIALALVLLVGAGLTSRSFNNLQSVDPGFDTEGVLTFETLLPFTRYEDPSSRIGFVDPLEERILAIPGVRSVGSVNPLPLSGRDGDTSFEIEGQAAADDGRSRAVWVRRATPGYFEALGLAVTEGRVFSRSDTDEAAPVVMINQTMADRFFGSQALGQRINVNNPNDPVWREVVGVVADVKNFGLRADSRNALYFPFHQATSGLMFTVIRADAEPGTIVPAIRDVVRGLDPGIAVTGLQSMSEQVDRTLQQDRFVSTVLKGFALVALFLAVVGLYSVIAYAVNMRRREMGVRIALGAPRSAIGGMVLRWVMFLAAAGALLGTVGAFVASRTLQGLLFGVSAEDPVTYVSVIALMGLTATVAGLLPAWRAVRVDPVEALSSD